jgi:hypothetical protein
MDLTLTEVFESEQPSATTFPLSPDLGTLDLSTSNIDAMLEWWLSLSERPALHAIRVYQVQDGNLATLNKFMGAVGQDLESFTLHPFVQNCTLLYVIRMMNSAVLTTSSGTRHSIDIAPLTHLRSIQLELHTLHPANRNRWVTQILSQISSVHLEAVAFQMFQYVGDIIDFDLSDVLEWSEVDAILQHSTFSRLKNVEIRSSLRLRKTFPAPEPQRPFSAEIVELLPRCHARGIFLR